MKYFLFNLFRMLYFLISISVLLLTVGLPFTWGAKDSLPIWVNVTIYVLAILIMANQEQIINWFDNQEKKFNYEK